MSLPEHAHLPPHALPVRNKNKAVFLLRSAAVTTLLTAAFSWGLARLGIPLAVIIPSGVPLWTGMTTLGYMMQVEK